jgi:hypothetical protein
MSAAPAHCMQHDPRTMQNYPRDKMDILILHLSFKVQARKSNSTKLSGCHLPLQTRRGPRQTPFNPHPSQNVCTHTTALR